MIDLRRLPEGPNAQVTPTRPRHSYTAPKRTVVGAFHSHASPSKLQCSIVAIGVYPAAA